MSKSFAIALATAVVLVAGCGTSDEGDRGWICTASAETDYGNDEIFHWHDTSKDIALQNALTNCRLHSSVAGMCTAGPSDCERF